MALEKEKPKLEVLNQKKKTKLLMLPMYKDNKWWVEQKSFNSDIEAYEFIRKVNNGK